MIVVNVAIGLTIFALFTIIFLLLWLLPFLDRKVDALTVKRKRRKEAKQHD